MSINLYYRHKNGDTELKLLDSENQYEDFNTYNEVYFLVKTQGVNAKMRRWQELKSHLVSKGLDTYDVIPFVKKHTSRNELVKVECRLYNDEFSYYTNPHIINAKQISKIKSLFKNDVQVRKECNKLLEKEVDAFLVSYLMYLPKYFDSTSCVYS